MMFAPPPRHLSQGRLGGGIGAGHGEPRFAFEQQAKVFQQRLVIFYDADFHIGEESLACAVSESAEVFKGSGNSNTSWVPCSLRHVIVPPSS